MKRTLCHQSILGGPIVSSPNPDDHLHPSPRLRHKKSEGFIPYIPDIGEVVVPTGDSASLSAEPEDIELPPRGGASHGIRSSFFTRSRSPSSHRTTRTWKRQRHSRSHVIPVVDDSDSEDSSYAGLVRTGKSLKPWRKFVQKLKNYDERMVRGWKEDIDTLLVFAGLFSAVLTAFIVDSYKLLQQDLNQATASLMQLVTNHLLGNDTIQITSTSPVSSKPSAFAVRINILWFMSLVFGLASASVGILAKQWLREYSNRTSSSPREAARIRQFRYAGLIRWHIPEIIAFLPVLLQLSLAFFFVGILDLLWQLNTIVAGVITFFVSLSLAFLVVTTILPSIAKDSPHRSPQALAVYLLRQWFVGLVISVLIKLVKSKWVKLRLIGIPIIHIDFSQQQRGSWRHRLARWLTRKLSQRQPRTWMQRERYYVDQQHSQLDQRLLVDADEMFMDDKVLAQVIRPCINEMQTTMAINCLMDILLNRAHKADDRSNLPMWQHHDSIDRGMSTLIYLTTDVLERINPEEEKHTIRVLNMFGNLCNSMPFKLDDPHILGIYHRVHEILAVFLVCKAEIARVAFQTMYKTNEMRNSSEDDISFSARVVKHIARYAHMEKENNEPHHFFNACSMALKYGTESMINLEPDEQTLVRKEIRVLLKDLEAYLRNDEHTARPSPSLVVALLGYVNQNPELVPGVNRLIDLLRPTIGVHGSALGQHGHSNSIDMHRRAFMLLRDIYSPRPNIRKQRAVHAQSLDQLGLHLPPLQTPPRDAVETAPAEDTV
ncbi:hypothetical protein BDY19DRAFT_930768 [Irpex rosettiformis]|uniref:Uncharacterized protein n=1 Tax=Irpex rosettiformis TaxID=378272 RepID=A0ACB8UB82_9APHY|nr:hypothetical protein BDY19DRAFT_930768 [Irpex rosettiformis]